VTLELDGVSILFIDTPGLAWEHSEVAPPEEKERRRAQDVLLRNKGRIDRLKYPLPAVSCIVSRAETEDLMVFYGLPAFAKGDVDAFLMGVARAQGLIKKVSQSPISHSFYLIYSFSFDPQGGKLDLAAAARIVLRDWSTGKLSRYAVPPAVSGSGTPANAVSPVLATIYEGDAALLERLPPRKEMRQSRDLVRLSSERVDGRTLAFDAPWFSTDAGDEDEDEASASELELEVEAEEIGSRADNGGDSEEEDAAAAAADDAGLGVVESDESEEDEDEVPQSARKRKRPQPSSLASPSSKSQLGPSSTVRPRKKVAFAASVKATSSSKDHTPLSRLSKTRPSTPYKKSDVSAKALAGTKTKPPPPPSRTRKSAANAPPPAAQRRKPGAGDGEYDFSKFF
jgi:nuclear GTP-binding protein